MASKVQIGGAGTLFAGEDKSIVLELLDVNGIPVDMSTFVLVLDVRSKDSSGTPARISVTATVAGVYNAVRTTNTQRATAALSASTHLAVSNLTELKKQSICVYRYSWKRMDSGAETVVQFGNFVVERATAP